MNWLSRRMQKESINMSDVGHLGLDTVGWLPGVGEVADLANAAWYASKGSWLNAAFSLISMIPVIGDIVGKGGKLAHWMLKNVSEDSAEATKIKTTIRTNSHLVDLIFDKAEQSGKFINKETGESYLTPIINALNTFSEFERALHKDFPDSASAEAVRWRERMQQTQTMMPNV